MARKPQSRIADLEAARIEAARATGAERARRWRESKKAVREPLPRDADAAIVEALAFLIARHRRDGVNNEGKRVAAVDPVDIGVMARLILEREGFDPDRAGHIVRQRLAPRDQHSWPDHMPTLKPGPVEWMRETRAGSWTTPIRQVYEYMLGRSANRT